MAFNVLVNQKNDILGKVFLVLLQERLMFELNSIRELNHRLSRLMDLSTGQKQYIGGENFQHSNSNDEKNTKSAFEATDNTHGNYGFPTHMNLELTKTNALKILCINKMLYYWNVKCNV